MAAQLSTLTPRTIRIYCPSHKVGFLVAAGAAIQCGSQTHTLAREFPIESFWEYCCDCQHYWPIDAGGANTASEECPVCERTVVRRFLCAACKVISVESDNAGRGKAFSISGQGNVTPACPGCLHRSTGSAIEHACNDLGCGFFTKREVCPFCDERLEPPPNFPCSVAAYVDKLPRSALIVSFDPETSLIKEAPAGKYYLIPLDRQSSLSIVIPKSTTLESRQDYYNSYYELFNCENPTAGEVMIVTPAIVESAEDGWRLREAGNIEIQPQAKENAATICPVCGIAGDAEHSFCRRCGARITSAPNEAAIDRRPVPNEQTSSASPESSVDQQSYVLPPIINKSSGPQTKTIFMVVGGIGLLAIVLTIAAIVSTNKTKPIEQKLDNAIARGQILTPATDSAQTLYYQLKNSGASEETLRNYREKLVPLLTDRPYRMIAQLMAPGSDDPPLADWQSAHQAMQWAVELKPGDTPLLARAAYCEGRIAFLSKDDNRAIQSWTRAADADKAWPLPVNGIGLIYFARRSYTTARSYYFDAVRRDPNWAYAYNNIGTSYFMERNYSDAKGYYQKAAELAPQWARPHSWLGDIAMKEGNYSTAVQEFSLVLDPNATGTKNMDLDKIRKQLDLARERSTF